MPVLNLTEQVETIYLPSTQKIKDGKPTAPESDWAYVEMDTSDLCAADSENLKAENGPDGERFVNEGKTRITIMANRIKSWNYTDASGMQLPINYETVKHMNAEDFGFLFEKIAGEKELTDDEKKALNSTTQIQVNTTA